jgi:hypothetical protein
MKSFLYASAALVLLACGAKTTTTTTTGPTNPTPPDNGDEAVVGPPTVAWKDMTKPQKGKFMKAVVLPRMKELFVEFDAEEFAEMDCFTCHGDDADDRKFEMPNPDILVLPANEEGWKKLAGEKGEWLKFMGGKVKPEMAKLLGMPEFNPKDPAPGTFACFNCHQQEGGAPAPTRIGK